MNKKQISLDQLLVNAYSKMTDWYILEFSDKNPEVSFSCTTQFNKKHPVDAYGYSGRTKMVIEVKSCIIDFERLHFQLFMEIEKRNKAIQIADKYNAMPILVYISPDGSLYFMDLKHTPFITEKFTTQKKWGVSTKKKETAAKHKFDALSAFHIEKTGISLPTIWKYVCEKLAQETKDQRYLNLDIDRTKNI